MALMFATPDAAVRAPVKWTRRTVLIGGEVTPCTDLSTVHSAGGGIGSATLVMATPYPAHVVPGAVVEVQAGYPGAIGTIFSGRIPKHTARVGAGSWGTVTARGWLDLLTDPHPTELAFLGPVPLKEIARAILALRRVPYWLVDDITWPDGSTVMLGINPLHDGGIVRIPRTAGLRQWLSAALALPGYFIFDTPSGVVRVQRISGEPVGESVIEVVEGQLGYEFDRAVDLDPMVTYRVVNGARLTGSDGGNLEIRSIPLTVEIDDRLAPLSYRKAESSSELLVTAPMADLHRNVLEITSGAPAEPVGWKTDLAPHVQVGDVATVVSPGVGATGQVWITDMTHSAAATSMKTTTFDGIRGNGVAQPAGQDCITIQLLDAPVHLGNETIPWYAHPAPQGPVLKIPFTVPDDYSSLRVTVLLHGSNSFMVQGKNSDSTVSRFEFWQAGAKVSEGTLPVVAENYAQRLPYGSDLSRWLEAPIPMTGSLKAGLAEFWIVAGVDTRLPVRTRLDDFEVQAALLRACGVGVPLFIEVTP